MGLRFHLFFSKKEFEYDVYNLVKAFYPAEDLDLLYLQDPDSPEDSGSSPENGAGSPEYTDLQALCRENADAVFLVKYTPHAVSFSYACREDLSEEECRKHRIDPAPWTECREDIPDDDTMEAKNRIKQLVYCSLRRMTGRELPWGDLTGIRPVRLVSRQLEDGRTPEEIAAYMQDTWFVSREKTALAVATAQREKLLMDALKPEEGYSLYVGIPFCPSICLYCSFGSHPLDRFRKMVGPYLETLYSELAFIGRTMAEYGMRLDTIYIGGGTPTTLAPDRLAQLLQTIQDCFPMDQVLEFTVEAGRPDTITPEKLQVLRRFPVTRISINPQTMNQKTLDLIGRKHTVEEIKEKYALARAMGFENINMDLIIGLPGEGGPEVRHTLDEIRTLGPDSLTVHALALKRATRLNLFRDTWAPVSFEASDEIMRETERCAADMGMHPYYLYRQKNMAGNFENVGYAREGKDCLYNILIMEERQTILAAGSGASTKFVYPGGTRIERAENVKDIGHYTERIGEMIERKKAGLEAWMENR